MALTKKQKHVLDYIVEYSNTHGYAPTQTEIMEHFQLKSLGSVQRYLKYLSNEGYIEVESNARRGIELLTPTLQLYDQTLNKSSSELMTSMTQTPEAGRLREIPLMGKVAAGSPIESSKHFEFVGCPEIFLKGNKQYFALEVSGESMIEDGIHDGDTIVVEQVNSAYKGETVVAMLGSEATVKKYVPFSDRVELHPANSSMKPIVVAGDQMMDLKIVGKLAALLRQY